MQPSPACIDLIKRSEGLRLSPYCDVAGCMTIGYGHKMTSLEPIEPISAEQAEELLTQDITITIKGLNPLIAGIELSQGQFDALTDFCFNLGCHALANSTLLKMLKTGDYAGACAQFTQWDHAGGIVQEGLLKRRQAEQALFNAA